MSKGRQGFCFTVFIDAAAVVRRLLCLWIRMGFEVEGDGFDRCMDGN